MANTIEFEAAKDTGRGSSKFLEHEGTYHLSVTGVDASPKRKYGESAGDRIDGFEITCRVVGGTVSSEVDKTVTLMFQNPSTSAKDHGEFAKRKQTRFLFVVGLIQESHVGQKLKLDLDAAIGRQFIAKFAKTSRTGRDFKVTEFIDLSYADMWHVDDKDVAAIPKSQSYLDLINVALRKTSQEVSQQRDLFTEQIKPMTGPKPSFDVSSL